MNRRPRTASNGTKTPKATRTAKTTDTLPTSLTKAESVSTRGEDSKTPKGQKDPIFGVDLTTTIWDHYPLVEIIWVDAVGAATIEWSTIDEILEEELAPSRAVGYMIESNQQRTVIVALVNERDAAHAMLIPNSMIHKINTLRDPK